MAHVLVVGGTGMLKNVSLFLAEHDNTVSVIARNEDRLQALESEAADLKGKINSISVDYSNTLHLRGAIEEATRRYGPIIMVVNWMSPAALAASDIIAEMVNTHSPICRFFQVLDHHNEHPEAEERFFSQPYGHLPRVLYRTISLGLKVEDGGLARLLNPAEVCEGVIDAVRNDRRNMIIGSTSSGARTQSA